MGTYRHHVSGFFARRKDAEGALARLVDRGLPATQLQLFDAKSAPQDIHPPGQSVEVLTNVLVDGAVGTAVGTGIGALAELALVAANVTLFVASPLIAPLVILGWGASLGALVGAAVGAQSQTPHKKGRFADLIRDATTNGQIVLLAETRTENETAIARQLIAEAVGEVDDVTAAP